MLYFLYILKGAMMTISEASEKYNIPVKILRAYESWGLCGEVKKVMGSWQYDDSDIERLSTIMTLHDIGFTKAEVERYMKLLLQGASGEEERLKMLEAKRNGKTANRRYILHREKTFAVVPRNLFSYPNVYKNRFISVLLPERLARKPLLRALHLRQSP